MPQASSTPLLDLSEVLEALSDLTRRQILMRLAVSDACCSSLKDLGPKTRLAYHVTKSGRRRILSLRREAVDAHFPGVLHSVLSSTEHKQDMLNGR